MKRILFLSFILMTVVMRVGATPMEYAELSSDETVLTFKYGEMPEKTNVWDVYDTGTYSPGWYKFRESITIVVFDESFIKGQPRSCFRWFEGMSNLISIIGLQNLNTNYVTNMSRTFYGCSKLTNLDVSGFIIHQVKDLSYMFYYCGNLITIYCDKMWSCEQSNNMFSGCTKLEGSIVYNASQTDVTYARYANGYFTLTQTYTIYSFWIAFV